MLNSALISRNLARLLRRGPTDLSSFAIERRELCPAEEVTRPPALHPDGAMDRIIALSPWRDWEVERGLIAGTPILHAPTEALILPDVVLAGAYLYRGGAKERIGHGEARMLDPDLPPSQTIPEACLVSGWTGADFFGNFMQDSLPLEMIPGGDAPRIAAPTKPYSHASGYRVLLDLPEPPMPRHARIGRLTIYRDFSQNSFKLARYRQLRARLRSAIGTFPSPKGIFIRRGSTQGEPRWLKNEEQLEEMLGKLRFDIIDPDQMQADTIARIALDAPVVVSVEGSHLGHALYALADGGAFLVIQPPNRFAMPYKEVADCLGMRFGFVVGHPDHGGFNVDLKEIHYMLERLA